MKTAIHIFSIIVALFFFESTLFAFTGFKESESQPRIQVEDFSLFDVGTFPKGWKVRGGDGKKVYAVRLDVSSCEGYLEAKATKCAVSIAKKFESNLQKYPLLTWQWRVIEPPEGGDERYKQTGDSAAGIYVIFKGSFRPKNIKYVWSASLPIGTTLESPYNNKTKIVVLRNQSSPLNTWVCEKVNVYEDFKKLFGEKPECIKAIGLMTDSDNTESTAVAHYKKIGICKE
ncbi:MAG: DUF3047 domain-containing protein [Thermodesulfobacteriota bacterium]|nr:DUF3047 domain-containing protein [Thermodesulfobacteriota bacterium]